MQSLKFSLFLASLISFSAMSAKSEVVQSDIFYDIASNDKAAVKKWLETKPNLTVKNTSGQSILTVAVLTGHWDMIALLIKAGASINEIDQNGKTVLDYAVESQRIKIARKLIKFHNAAVAKSYNAQILKSSYKHRALGFFIAGLVFTPLLWIGSFVALNDVSSVWVLNQ